jgi:hypothetical protein
VVEAVKVHALVHLGANVAKIVVEQRGRITRKEPATVRSDFREGLLFTAGRRLPRDNRPSRA